MTVQLPPAPYRITLAAALTAQGRMKEAAGAYTCGCSRLVMAGGFFDVRDQPPGAFGGQPFACDTCVSDLMRREAAAHEEACRQAKQAAGILEEEFLNGLRAERDMALLRSDWTQLMDNRTRIGPVMAVKWDAYRAEWREWFAVARDTGTITSRPELPKEDEDE